MTETATSRSFSASDLLGGEDADFVINLYVALLDRWPDPNGFDLYLEQIAGKPERRVETLCAIAGSDEAKRGNATIDFGQGTLIPPPPARWAAFTTTLRTKWLQRKVERLQEAVGLLGGASFVDDLVETRQSALLLEFSALKREVMERLAGQTMADGAVDAMARLIAEHSAGLVAAAEAKVERRLITLEGRLLALETRAG